MTSRVVLVSARQEPPVRERGLARDGWRVFRSPNTGFEIALPAYQVSRVEAIAKREHTEWYALAVGELLRDDKGVHAVVRDFVPNDWAERGRAHVRMSATAEAKVRELARELHPNSHQLGNLHTHPHFTTEPSSTDRQEFWSDPNSVSIIVDPFDSPTIAIYRGREGEQLVEVTGGDEPRPPTPAPAATPTAPSAPVAPTCPIAPHLTPPCVLAVAPPVVTERFDARALAGALVLSALFLGCFAVLGYSVERRLADVAAMNVDVASTNASLRERVRALEVQVRLSGATKKPEDGDEDTWDSEYEPAP
ncbi:MAG TPA: Mov34/MPN/PAD-1 family protein [Polyangiaceae bacterium]|nr:Mov34/MPN/PAD-1 family protein [Polyangiaceae bacterium]